MHAFSEITSFALVSSVRAVGDIVADRSHIDATGSDAGTLPLSNRATEGRRHTSVLVRFIGIVAAIVFSVANVCFEDTFRVLTLEEVIRT